MTGLYSMKAPFPWFGGKSRAAAAVWAALGDPAHYVEPFGGSLAVLLNRPHPANRPYHSETVNDADGLLVNAWRSIQWHPEQTAEAASWPVAEADLHARHCALIGWRQSHELEHLMGDPRWCDPEIAGWWLWGIACWIGGGWCSGTGSWWPNETGRLAGRRGVTGVKRQLPHLTNDGQGVNRPSLRKASRDGLAMPDLLAWFRQLSARLRHVRVLNGDWARAVTPGAVLTLQVRKGGGHAGVFVDPPYAEADCEPGLYVHGELDIVSQVRDWCLAHGNDPRWRIVLAGFEGEHQALEAAGWTAVAWFEAGWLTGGYGGQQDRERLWLSPHCCRPSRTGQPSLLELL